LFLCLFCFGSFGCGLGTKAAPPLTFYTLEYDSPVPEKRPALPAIVRIERFGVDPAYNSREFVYSDASYARKNYPYDRWRANPGDLVTYFLARDMKRAGLFSAALTYDTNVEATHSLEGTVEEFYELDLASGWEAALSLDVTLVKLNEPDVSKRVVLQQSYRVSEKASRKNPQAVAEAMSNAMAKISARIMNDIYSALEKEKKKD
jgi:cholesterol transport system auxiliary component